MKEQFKLEPVDILIKINEGEDPYSIVKRWALGNPYEHALMYLGNVGIVVSRRQHKIIRFPMLFESNGQGVVIQSLSNRYGQKVVVLRLKTEHDRRRIPSVLLQAIELASPGHYYDYLCVVKYAIPRLICEKLGLPMPLAWHRNEFQICSEAVWEVFYRAGIKLLPSDIVPLPGDFVTDSVLLEKVWTGILSEEKV